MDIRVGLSGALYYMDGFSRTVRHLRNLVSQVLLQICVYTAQRSMFGTSFLRQGWRVDGIVINQLLKGLCDSKCASEAMNILLRRMPEFGCSPDLVSYNRILKGLCDEKRAEEALQLLHMMVDDECGSCPPDVVSYNTVINGFFRDDQVDRAYNRLL